MKHVIIGTAGHVDHGKTLLVKALTGIDTDRLKEEKKRGITIELGFAHLDWPDGTQAGIVDVPGHEKFIKNMLAGAGGIDLAMLIIAADDGVMPQTVEHLDILTLLGIRDGLIVITKADTVDPEWLEMMQEEIREKTVGSFLEGKPILAVSAYTGQGIPELKEMLRQLVQQAEEKSLRIPFRLPVDRVFSVEGFGTVVTGTLIEGAIHEGDLAQLVPSGTQTRIRNLQVHGKNVETAYAGQRVAINLAGLKKEDIQRGNCVAKPGSVRISRMLDVRLQNLRDSQRIIQNDSQVHLFHGSAVHLAKVVLFGRDELKPGESCYAQLRLTEPIATKNGDRFVIRFFSPLETIGGGIILDDQPRRHKRSDPRIQEILNIKESGSRDDLTVQLLAEFGTRLPTAVQLMAKLQREEAAWQANTQLITAISHDVRTPLTALMGYLEILSDESVSPEERQAYLQVCKNNAVRLKSLTDELFGFFLVFGKPTVDQSPEEYDAAMLLDQILLEHEMNLNQQDFRVEMNREGDLTGKLRVDLTHLRRVFDNLFSNVNKYADHDHPVAIRIKRSEEELIVSITNHIGAQSNRRESNRIGLQTCHKLVAAMGGEFSQHRTKDTFSVEVLLPLITETE